jgi:hypothetical protein
MAGQMTFYVQNGSMTASFQLSRHKICQANPSSSFMMAMALTWLQKCENLPKKTTLNSFASLHTLPIALSLSTLEFLGPYRHIGRNAVIIDAVLQETG